jgi:hypothetical protein
MDDFDLAEFTINPMDPRLVPARTARRGDHKARRYFVKVPLEWLQRLEGAPGQTYRLALLILYRSWRNRGASIALTNRTIETDGVPAQSKRRALRDLERRGLVRVDWHSNRSPIVRILVD